MLLLFYLLAVRRTAAHIAATVAAMTCAVLAVVAFHMPVHMAIGAIASGWVYGIIRVGWVVLAAVFVYELAVESGHFEVIKQSIGGVTSDRRLQVLLIAFAFGSILEGAGGGGAPVAIAGSILQTGANINRVGPGFNINGFAPFGGAAATPPAAHVKPAARGVAHPKAH